MRKLIYAFLAVSCLISLFACSKAGDNPLNPVTGGNMSATIGGTSWTSSSSMTYYTAAAAPVGTTMIGASVPDSRQIDIHWKDLLSVGTVNLVAGSTDYMLYWIDYPTSKRYDAISGTVTISSISSDGKVTGTFQCQVKLEGGSEVLTITGGVFTDVKKIGK